MDFTINKGEKLTINIHGLNATELGLVELEHDSPIEHNKGTTWTTFEQFGIKFVLFLEGKNPFSTNEECDACKGIYSAIINGRQEQLCYFCKTINKI